MMTSPRINGQSTASVPGIGLGSITNVQGPEHLPAAPAGTKWEQTRQYKGLPLPLFEYRLVRATPAPSSEPATIGGHPALIVTDFFALPKHPEEPSKGQELVWRSFGFYADKRAVFVEMPRPPETTAFLNALDEALKGDVVSPDTAASLQLSFVMGGADDVRIRALKAALDENPGKFSAGATERLRNILADSGLTVSWR